MYSNLLKEIDKIDYNNDLIITDCSNVNLKDIDASYTTSFIWA
jgi:hypothetical protein